MKNLLYILVIVLLTFSSYAAEIVEPGHVIAEKSLVFTMKEEKKLRENNEKRLKLEDLRIYHERKIEIQQKRIDNLKDYVEDHKSLTTTGKIGWFLVGFIASTAATYITIKVVQEAKQ